MATIYSSYLDGLGNGSDYVWDDGSNLGQSLPQKSEVVIVDAKFSHDKK
jgi:hypothetical protein